MTGSQKPFSRTSPGRRSSTPGEFLRLLKYLRPDEEESYQKGYKEVEDMIKKLKKK